MAVVIGHRHPIIICFAYGSGLPSIWSRQRSHCNVTFVTNNCKTALCSSPQFTIHTRPITITLRVKNIASEFLYNNNNKNNMPNNVVCFESEQKRHLHYIPSFFNSSLLLNKIS